MAFQEHTPTTLDARWPQWEKGDDFQWKGMKLSKTSDPAYTTIEFMPVYLAIQRNNESARQFTRRILLLGFRKCAQGLAGTYRKGAPSHHSRSSTIKYSAARIQQPPPPQTLRQQKTRARNGGEGHKAQPKRQADGPWWARPIARHKRRDPPGRSWCSKDFCSQGSSHRSGRSRRGRRRQAWRRRPGRRGA